MDEQTTHDHPTEPILHMNSNPSEQYEDSQTSPDLHQQDEEPNESQECRIPYY